MHIVRLQRSWRAHRVGNRLELRSALFGRRLAVSDGNDGCVFAALQLLRSGVSGPDYAATLSTQTRLSVSSCEALLRKLNDLGCLTTGEYDDLVENESTSPFDRQERFFSLFEKEGLTGRMYQDRLAASTVVVVGIGGYGVWLATLCRRIGIGKIIIVDPDVIEATNLSRQFLYNDEDVGQAKVDVCLRELGRFHSGGQLSGLKTRIEKVSDLEQHLAGVDLVFNSFGYTYGPSGELGMMGLVTAAAVRAEVPCLTFGGSWIGPLTVPGVTPCCGCVQHTKEYSQILQMTADFAHEGEPAPAFAPRLAIGAATASWEAARFLTGIDEPPSKRGFIMLDTFRYSAPSRLEFERSDTCSLCSTSVMSARQSWF